MIQCRVHLYHVYTLGLKEVKEHGVHMDASGVHMDSGKLHMDASRVHKYVREILEYRDVTVFQHAPSDLTL